MNHSLGYGTSFGGNCIKYLISLIIIRVLIITRTKLGYGN